MLIYEYYKLNIYIYLSDFSLYTNTQNVQTWTVQTRSVEFLNLKLRNPQKRLKWKYIPEMYEFLAFWI